MLEMADDRCKLENKIFLLMNEVPFIFIRPVSYWGAMGAQYISLNFFFVMTLGFGKGVCLNVVYISFSHFEVSDYFLFDNVNTVNITSASVM